MCFQNCTWGRDFVVAWIKPWGTIFINLLKLIAIPLIVASLIKGVSDLDDIRQLSRLGTRTLGLYIVSTVLAVILGLLIVNIVNPGGFIEESTRTELMASFGANAEQNVSKAGESKNRGPLSALVDVVPDNVIGAASSNGNMLQVIFFVVFFGIGLILIPQRQIRASQALFRWSQ